MLNLVKIEYLTQDKKKKNEFNLELPFTPTFCPKLCVCVAFFRSSNGRAQKTAKLIK